MLVRAKRQKPLGAHPRCPLLRGTAKEIVPCEGSIPGHVENFEGLRISILVFLLLQETTKEDAISYRDWRSKIEDALQRGHDATKVKEAMFASLEGMARDNAKMIDENRDLDGLGSLYGVSMTFQSLNAALCGLQQKPMESARTYNRMAQITVILRECHGNRYRPGELARMSKDCFYAGLLPENCPMVVHLKDQPHTTPLEISKHRSGHCFNCQKEGHHWCQCKEILSPELQELSDQQDREREERKKKALNPRGGMGMRGGHAPTP